MKKVFNLLNIIFNIKNKNQSKKTVGRNIYLDNAAATPIEGRVLLAMHQVENLYSNPSGIYRSGVEAKNKIEQSRKIISSILNCHSNEVFFTGSGTESLNMAITGYVNNYLELNFKNEYQNKNENKKPIIVTTNTEHSAVLGPILHLEKKGKIEIKYLEVDVTGKVKANDLQKILNEEGERVVLVSIIYANNETGRVQPVKEIGRMIDLHNNKTQTKIVYHIDAMQAGNYLDVDIKKLRADMMSLNGSKIYGPKGVGVLYKNKNINILPIIMGGGQENGIRSGTEDVVKIVGMAEALQSSQEKRESEVARLLELQNYFLEKIKIEIPNVNIYNQQNDINKIVSKTEAGTPFRGQGGCNIKINYFNIDSLPNNINIGLPGMLSDEMVVRLDYAGYDVSHKSACASNEIGEGSYVLRAMGANEKESKENIRITMGRSTTKKDLDKLIINVREIYKKYKKDIF